MTDAQLAALTARQFPHAVLAAPAVPGTTPAAMVEPRDATLDIAPQALPEIAAHLVGDPDTALDMLMLITGVDVIAEGQIRVVYHLDSSRHGHRLVLRCSLPREDPRLPSVAAIWPAADWHERETYDLLGVVFTGHANLQRILLPDDWTGHPLRRDYAFPREYHGIPCSRDYAETHGMGLPTYTGFSTADDPTDQATPV